MKFKFPYFEESTGGEGDGGGDGGGGNLNVVPDSGSVNPGDSASPGGDTGTSFLTTLPETWRTDLVNAAGFQGEDATRTTNYLERVSDLPTLVKNYASAQDRIRKGELSNGLPANPTEQQLADWRTAQGVPTSHEDYKTGLGEGFVLGEEDKRILDTVYPVAHKHNIPTAAVTEMVNTFMEARQHEMDLMLDNDNLDKTATDRALRDTWGGDYVANINAVRGLIELLPESTRDNFLSARMADRRAVFNDPAFVVAVADWARQINPSATVVPNSNNPVQAIKDEIKELEAKMGTNEWYKDLDAQKRYQDLLDAQSRMNK